MNSLLLSFLLFSATASANGQNGTQRIMILTAKGGDGHVSASRAIENAILAEGRARGDEIYVKEFDIAGFLRWPLQQIGPPLLRWALRNSPLIMQWQWDSGMDDLENLTDPADLVTPGIYDLDRLAKTIEHERPEIIYATMIHAAKATLQLRREGKIPADIKIAWMMTDYLDNQKHMKLISKALDMTFLPARQMYESWIRYGIPPHKIAITGIAVSPEVFVPQTATERTKIRKQEGFDPAAPLVSIIGGGEGAIDFANIILKMNEELTRSVQFLIFAGRNPSQHKKLDRILRNGLLNSRKIRFKYYPWVQNPFVLSRLKASDVVITKSGAVTPTELIGMQVPFIALDYLAAQEKENAKFYEKNGLALVNRMPEDLPKQLEQLLFDKDLRMSMRRAQAQLAADFSMQPVIEFLSSAQKNSCRKAVWDLRDAQAQ